MELNSDQKKQIEELKEENIVLREDNIHLRKQLEKTTLSENESQIENIISKVFNGKIAAYFLNIAKELSEIKSDIKKLSPEKHIKIASDKSYFIHEKNKETENIEKTVQQPTEQQIFENTTVKINERNHKKQEINGNLATPSSSTSRNTEQIREMTTKSPIHRNKSKQTTHKTKNFGHGSPIINDRQDSKNKTNVKTKNRITLNEVSKAVEEVQQQAIMESLINPNSSVRHLSERANKELNNYHKPTSKIIGTSLKHLGISAAEKLKWLYIGNLSTSTTEEQLKSYINSCDIELKTCARLQTKNEFRASFKVAVNFNEADRLLDSEMWPQNTVIKPFIHNHNQNQNFYHRRRFLHRK